jgi:hypothetical protein
MEITHNMPKHIAIQCLAEGDVSKNCSPANLAMAVTGKKGVGIPSIVLHECEGTVVTIGKRRECWRCTHCLEGKSAWQADAALV